MYYSAIGRRKLMSTSFQRKCMGWSKTEFHIRNEELSIKLIRNWNLFWFATLPNKQMPPSKKGINSYSSNYYHRTWSTVDLSYNLSFPFSKNKLKKVINESTKGTKQHTRLKHLQLLHRPRSTQNNQKKLRDLFCRPCWQFQLPTVLSREGLWLE